MKIAPPFQEMREFLRVGDSELVLEGLLMRCLEEGGQFLWGEFAVCFGL